MTESLWRHMKWYVAVDSSRRYYQLLRCEMFVLLQVLQVAELMRKLASVILMNLECSQASVLSKPYVW